MLSKSQQHLIQLERYANDPWAFLCECVYTRDQVDKVNPIKKFPSEWPYLKFYVKMWQVERLIAVPKSRRMTMSWTNIALYLWATIFTKGQDFAFVSKKEDDAGELVRRAEFIFDHIPEDKIPKELLPRKETRAKPAALIFPEIGSKIQGFPMGADQLRQFTFSGILGDECAFWEEARQFYAAAFPTVEGGGRMSLISSRSPGFFQRLCYDALGYDGPIDETYIKPSYPLGDDSIILWKNPKNQFAVIDIHYTANPKKKDPTFRETIRSSMPVKDFMVEYERNWEVFSGKPVFEDYSKSFHENSNVQPHLGLPLLIGVDFGLTPACVVAQLQGGSLIIFKEFIGNNIGIKKFMETQVLPGLSSEFPEWRDAKNDFRWYIDPAGLQKAQTDERTCAGTMMECGIRSIFPGPLNWEARRKSVEHFLTLRTREGAGLQLNPKEAPLLSRGFSGGYCYPEKYETNQPDNYSPIKNNYSHPHDALQYLCGGALALKGLGKQTKEIPAPRYSFTETQSAPEKEHPGLEDYNFTGHESGRQ